MLGAGDRLSQPDRVGQPQALACHVSGQEASIGRRRAGFVLPLERPRSVGSLIPGEPGGGTNKHLRVLHDTGPLRRGQGRRELHAGQPLVGERTVAAIVVPPLRVAQPGRGLRKHRSRRRRGRRRRPA